jgi:hypothetical protein
MKNDLISINKFEIKNLHLSEADENELVKELEEGVDKKDDEITAFKVEQKITNITNSKSLNIGGFVNGSSNIKNMQVRYLVTLFTNKFKIYKTEDGKVIRKRLGYGYGFTLDVNDIDTNINANFGVIAASAALKLSKVSYSALIYGAITAKLAKYLPENEGTFNTKSFEQLQRFIKEAKSELNNDDTSRLYPIEILDRSYKQLENADTRSIYFGALKVKEGLKLRQAIIAARELKTIKINENVIQFMYTYFDVKNASKTPSSDQKQNARRWISGSYNKRKTYANNDSNWVDIYPVVDKNNNFIVLSDTALADEYKPHPKPENWANEGKLMKDETSYVSLDFSSSLKIASTLDISGRFNSVTINRTIALSTDVTENPYEGSKIQETRYGVGIRLKVKISNIAIGTDINYNVVGAVSEMGHANVEYEISGIGISDTSFLAELPGPINISQNSMEDINKAFNKLKKKLAATKVDKLNPQPYAIKVSEPKKIDPTLTAQAAVYSYMKVAEKTRLNEAISEAIELGIDKTDIANTYKLIGITNNDRISRSDKIEARDWLLMREE